MALCVCDALSFALHKSVIVVSSQILVNDLHLRSTCSSMNDYVMLYYIQHFNREFDILIIIWESVVHRDF